MNNESKSIFKSKTFWGTIVSFLPQLLPALGVAAGPAGTIVSLAGAAFAVYGRLDASSPAHIIPPSSDSMNG